MFAETSQFRVSAGGGTPAAPSKKLALQSAAGQQRVTKMLLVVSTMFLLLNLPSHTIRIYFFIVSLIRPNYRPPTLMLSLQKLFIYIYYVNFAINFFLYSLCGNNFRKALWQLLKSPCVGLKRRLVRGGDKRGSGTQRDHEEIRLRDRTKGRAADSVVSCNYNKTSTTLVSSAKGRNEN